MFQSGRLSVGSLTIAVDRPIDVGRPHPVAAGDLLAMAGGQRDLVDWPDWSADTGLDAILGPARELVARRDLVGLARLVGGRGPGLTPAGDDLLAGVLVIDALLHPDQDADRQEAAKTSATTDVAAAFLHWAAQGQCIAPFHAVVAAIAAGRPDQESAARAALLTIGASSGEALLLGLDLALSGGCWRRPGTTTAGGSALPTSER